MSDIKVDSQAGRDPVEEMVFLYLEEREEGLVAGYDDFARRHPDSSAAVRERIDALERAGLMSDDAQPEFPERLGNFRLIERLGGGGMGIVFLAEEESLGRRVALKLIRPEQIYMPQAKERFRREVEAVAKLAHPGIVQVYSFSEDGGVPFFAMELVEGASLGQVLAQFAGRSATSLSGADLARVVSTTSGIECSKTARFEGSWVRSCLEIARQVAVALQHAHERGVVHRDIKPSNVMITPDGRARLLDFGLASSAGASRLTRTGAQLGSLPYMPPELVSGRVEAAGASADVYSLGATLHEALALSLPFQGDSSALLAQRIASGAHESVRRRNPDVSTDAETVCNVAMELDPARRYASAGALAADLACVLERRPIAARGINAWVRTQRWVQRSPAGAAAAVLGLLVIAGGPLGYGFLQGRSAEKERRLNADLRDANQSVRDVNSSLEQAKHELETKNADLASSLAGEERERARAQRNFANAFDAIDQMLVSVGADELLEIPHFDPVRTKLLERALEFYAKLQVDDPTDIGVRREMARTARSIGDVLEGLGRDGEAKQQYELAVERARTLLESEQADADTRYILASTLSQLGNVYSRENKRDEARAAYDEMLPVIEQLFAEVPENTRYGHALATGLTNRGLIDYQSGALDEALERFTRSAAIGRGLLAKDPGEEMHYDALSSALSYRGMCEDKLGNPREARAAHLEGWTLIRDLVAQGSASRTVRTAFLENTVNFGLELMTRDPAQAERVLRGGFDAGRKLMHDFPNDALIRRGVVGLAGNLGIHLGNQARWADSELVLEVAVAEGERLCRDLPDRVEFPFLLASAFGGRSVARLNRGQQALALEDAVHAVALVEGVRKIRPNDPAILATSAACIMQRGQVELESGDWRRGAESIGEALELHVLRNDVCFQAFETYWNCARKAQADTSLSSEARAGERDALAEAALEQLDAAIQGGFGDLNRLQTLEDYAGLRDFPRFAELISDLAARSK